MVSILTIPIENDDKDMLLFLLHCGAKPNAGSMSDSYRTYDISYAIRLKAYNCIKTLIKYGYDINNKISYESAYGYAYTLTSYLIDTMYDPKIAKILLKNGANINFIGSTIHDNEENRKTYFTALDYAINTLEYTENNTDKKNQMIKILKAYGAKRVFELKPKLKKELLNAIMDNNVNTLKKYIESYIEINYKTDDGLSLLMLSAKNGSYDIAQYLIENGISLEDKSKYNNTAIEAKGYQGQTPLLLAAEVNNNEAAALLLEKGANIDAKDANGNTALDIAGEKGFNDIMKLIDQFMKN